MSKPNRRKIPTNITLSPEHRARLDTAEEKTGLNRSEIVARLIESPELTRLEKTLSNSQ